MRAVLRHVEKYYINYNQSFTFFINEFFYDISLAGDHMLRSEISLSWQLKIIGVLLSGSVFTDSTGKHWWRFYYWRGKLEQKC